MSAALATHLSPDGSGPDAFRPIGMSPQFPLADREFRRIAARMEAATGIRMGDDKHTLVHSRIQKRLRKLGLGGFADYCDLLDGPDGADERVHFVNALTTNLTSFFREPHHFKHLVHDALGPLVPEVRRGGRLRLWSAGCSTGEEPTCIAMMLLSVLPQAASLDARILATDIDCDVLRRAHRADYPASAVNAIPPALRSRFFDAPDGPGEADTIRARAAVRDLITLRKMNLNAADWPMRGQFDAIFCRNTLIYFDDERQARILDRFCDRLTPGGFLYLGHSERLSGTAESRLERVGTTIFRKIA